MTELNNCPFCGNLLEIVRKNGSKYVRCISGICIFETARHGYHISDDELIKRCNRRPAEDEKNKEIERIKNRVARLELFLFKIQEISTPHIGSLALYQAEMKAINRSCKVALGKDTNAPTNDTDNNVKKMEERKWI